MNDLNMSGSPNDYLARLGLSQDPFAAEVDAEFYYENPELMQRLDMIQHLIGFSNQMIFVSGPHGIGKTAMLDRLEYYAPDHWRICRIEANPMMSTPTLLRQLASGFGVEVHAQGDDLFEAYSNALEDHIQQLERAMHTPVVLIDNAHELPVDAFTLLFGFMQQDSRAHLKMALFCEPQIKAMLDSPQLRILADNIVHHLDIPELNEARTREYLEKRLQFAGLEDEFPFLPDTLRRIHRLSEGIPGRINTLAEQALLDEDSQALPVVDEVLAVDEDALEFDLDEPEKSKSDSRAAPIGRRFQSWQIGAVAVVMALLAAVLWITSKLNDDTLPAIAEDVPLDLQENSAKATQDRSGLEAENAVLAEGTEDLPISLENRPDGFDEAPDLAANVTAETSQIDPMDALVEELEAAHKANVASRAAESQPALETSVEIDADGNVQIIEKPANPINEAQTTMAQTATETPDMQTPEPALVAEKASIPAASEEEKAPESPSVATSTQPPIAETLPIAERVETRAPAASPVVDAPIATPTARQSLAGIHDNAWIRQQADNSFFLQLLGTHDMAALQKFLTENPVGNNTAWMTTQHEGKPWYVLVQGPYPSRAKAVESKNALPETIRARGPWPRSTASLKQIMTVE